MMIGWVLASRNDGTLALKKDNNEELSGEHPWICLNLFLSMQKVNLSKLETDALLRYWRRFKLASWIISFVFSSAFCFSAFPLMGCMYKQAGRGRSTFFQAAACRCSGKTFQFSGKEKAKRKHVWPSKQRPNLSYFSSWSILVINLKPLTALLFLNRF